MKRLIGLLALILLMMTQSVYAGSCPDYLNQSFKKLHSDKALNPCEAYAGKPLLIVNTASFCGYTPQFAGLEKLHKQYKDKGLVVLGFASDDFDQEAENDKAIADVCFINYGVTFDMFSPIHIKGDNANALFKALAGQSKEPAWNFNKYVLDKNGKVVNYFDSNVTPESGAMRQAIEPLLAP
jgi:glutathione peroxidase